MPSTPLLRWGALLSVVAAVAFAVALRLQQQPLTNASLSSAVTHCYDRIRTHDPDQPSAQCFSVVDGLFSRVWTKGEDDASVESNAVETSSGHVIPGLWDGHGHLLHYGQFLHSVDLFGSQSLDDVRSRITAYIDANTGAGTKGRWVRGVGWDQAAFGRMPTAVRLSSLASHLLSFS